jgi:hypothetical protein
MRISLKPSLQQARVAVNRDITVTGPGIINLATAILAMSLRRVVFDATRTLLLRYVC